jgi:hypothetical protein
MCFSWERFPFEAESITEHSLRRTLAVKNMERHGEEGAVGPMGKAA